jgi:hypothetical protein
MTDQLTELMALVEKHKWAIFPQTGGGWIVETADCYGDDGQEREIVRTRKTLIETLWEAVEDELPQDFEKLRAAPKRTHPVAPNSRQSVSPRTTGSGGKPTPPRR